jgi:hypothetical protein
VLAAIMDFQCGFGSESSLDELAATMKRTVEPPHQDTFETTAGTGGNEGLLDARVLPVH